MMECPALQIHPSAVVAHNPLIHLVSVRIPANPG